MKKLFTITVGALMAITVAHAQFVPEAQPFQLFTNSGAILIEGSSTSNAPVTMAYQVPVGKNGIGLYLAIGATNAATTTNATVLVELVNTDTLTGFTNVIDNQTFTLSVPQTGTTRYDYFTNLLSTTANYGNGLRLRIKSIQNTNLASIWITNAVAYIRE